MTPPRYSSKDQERFYQTRRLRVLVDEYSTEGRSWRTTYSVVIQDMVTREVKDHLLWPFYGKHNSVPIWSSTLDPPGNWGGRKLTHKAETKAEAVKWAKIEAVDLELPFDLQADIIDIYDAVEGEVVECLVCGRSWPNARTYREKLRGWTLHDARVCDSCRRHAEMGKAGEQDRKAYALHPGLTPWKHGLHDTPIVDVVDDDGLVIGKRYADRPTPDEDLLQCILGLTNARIEGTTQPYHRDIEGNILLDKQGHEKPYRALLTEQQAHWIQRLIDVCASHVHTAFLAGKEQGSSLLRMLSRADLNPDDFEQMRGQASNQKPKN